MLMGTCTSCLQTYMTSPWLYVNDEGHLKDVVTMYLTSALSTTLLSPDQLTTNNKLTTWLHCCCQYICIWQIWLIFLGNSAGFTMITHYFLTLMLLVATLDKTKWCKKPEKLLKPWQMGTHLIVLSKSFQMNTNTTGLGYLSKILAFLYLGQKWPQHWKG